LWTDELDAESRLKSLHFGALGSKYEGIYRSNCKEETGRKEDSYRGLWGRQRGLIGLIG